MISPTRNKISQELFLRKLFNSSAFESLVPRWTSDIKIDLYFFPYKYLEFTFVSKAIKTCLE